MGISIYYAAHRAKPLTPHENEQIVAVIDAYSIEDKRREADRTGQVWSWEDFCVYPLGSSDEPDVIFEGATKLPLESEIEFWASLQYWCQLLSEIRRVLSNAAWTVHVDDYPIQWDEAHAAYDPSV